MTITQKRKMGGSKKTAYYRRKKGGKIYMSGRRRYPPIKERGLAALCLWEEECETTKGYGGIGWKGKVPCGYWKRHRKQSVRCCPWSGGKKVIQFPGRSEKNSRGKKEKGSHPVFGVGRTHWGVGKRFGCMVFGGTKKRG